MKARVFVASSVEHLDLAYAVQDNLEHDAEVTVWSQGVFRPSRTTMASLIDQLDKTDFAVFVLAPDDVTVMRDNKIASVRDNVIYELGLFSGKLGIERCFMIAPRGNDDLHLPTDLLGLTPVFYEPDRQDGNIVAATGSACNRIRISMKMLGLIKPPIVSPVEQASVSQSLCEDENDCISIIQSWMGSRPSTHNVRAIRFDEVDEKLNLAPGSARKYLAKAASHWHYVVERQGRDTVLFRQESPSPYY